MRCCKGSLKQAFPIRIISKQRHHYCIIRHFNCIQTAFILIFYIFYSKTSNMTCKLTQLSFFLLHHPQECAARCSTRQTAQSTRTSCTAKIATDASTDQRDTVSAVVPAAYRWTPVPNSREKGKFRAPPHPLLPFSIFSKSPIFFETVSPLFGELGTF